MLEGSHHFQILPFEVWGHIFSYLEIEDLPRVSRTCQLFFNTINERFRLSSIEKFPLALRKYGEVHPKGYLNFYIGNFYIHRFLKREGTKLPSGQTMTPFLRIIRSSDPIFLREHHNTNSTISDNEVITLAEHNKDCFATRWDYKSGKELSKVEIPNDDWLEFPRFFNNHIVCPTRNLFRIQPMHKFQGKGYPLGNIITVVEIMKGKIFLGLSNNVIMYTDISAEKKATTTFLNIKKLEKKEEQEERIEKEVEKKEEKEKEKEQEVEKPKTYIQSLFDSGNFLFVGYTAGEVKIFEWKTKKLHSEFNLKSKVEVIRSDEKFAFIPRDNSVICWDLIENKQVCSFLHPGVVTSIELMDGILISTASDGVLRFWDLKPLKKINENEKEALFSPCNEYEFTKNKDNGFGYDTIPSRLSDLLIKRNHLLFVRDDTVEVYDLLKLSNKKIQRRNQSITDSLGIKYSSGQKCLIS